MLVIMLLLLANKDSKISDQQVAAVSDQVTALNNHVTCYTHVLMIMRKITIVLLLIRQAPVVNDYARGYSCVSNNVIWLWF